MGKKVMDQTLVSIIVPTFNSANYVKDLIECILKQQESSWELIFVDDGSEDETKAIIESYSKYDSRIIYSYRELNREKGSATCRNIGMEIMSGKYFIHIDADDLVSETFISGRVEFMERNLKCDYSTFKAVGVTFESGQMRKLAKYWGHRNDVDLLKGFLSTNYPFSIWNNIYRSSTMKKFKWNENVKIYTDFSYAVPIIVNKANHVFSDKIEPDYYYRMDIPNSMTRNFVSEEKFNSTLNLFEEIYILLEENGLKDQYRLDFRKFFNLQMLRLCINRDRDKLNHFLSFSKRYYSPIELFNQKVSYVLLKFLEKLGFSNGKFFNLIFYLLLYPKYVEDAIAYKFSEINRRQK